MRFLAAILLLLLVFAFPQIVFGGEVEHIEVFHHEICADGEVHLVSYKITIPTWLTVENRALVVFSEVFNNAQPDKMIFAPQGVEVRDVLFFWECGHLLINLSADIMLYGGTYFEYRLVEKLLANAAAMPHVAYFTVLIEGQIGYLPEGTKLFAKNVV